MTESGPLFQGGHDATFARLFFSSPLSILITRVESDTVVEVNDMAARTLGMRRDEIIGQSYRSLGFVSDTTQRRILLIIAKEGKYANQEIAIRTRSGTTRIGLASGECLDFNGEACVIHYITDITDLRALEMEADLTHERLRSFFGTPLMGMAVYQPGHGFTDANAVFCRITGRSDAELRNSEWLPLIHPDDREYFEVLLHELENGFSETINLEQRIIRPDGSALPVETSAQRIHNRDKESYIAVIMRDNEAYAAAREAMIEQSRQLTEAQEVARLGIWSHDFQSGVSRWSAQVYRCFGMEPGGPAPEMRDIVSKIHPEDRQIMLNATEAIQAGAIESADYEVRAVLPDGRSRWMWIRAYGLKNRLGQITGLRGVVLDTHDLKESTEKINYLAMHDTLTGLPNRLFLKNHIEHLTTISSGKNFALLFLDLDRFKNINDSLGHHIGDALLVEITRRLREALREDDLVARLGGDEFIVVLHDVISLFEIDNKVALILEKVRQKSVIDNFDLHLSTSIGIAIFPRDGQNYSDLLRKADYAMYVAKEKGRNRAQYVTSDMERKARRRLETESDLRNAVQMKQFMMYFQPIWSLATGRISGLEALLRWQHPVRGIVSPGEFLEIAQETGQIMDIEAFTIYEVCRLISEWDPIIPDGVRFSINVSPVHFVQEHFLSTLRSAIRYNATRPSRIKIEITEGTLLQNIEETSLILEELQNMAVEIALDDFGTGYSSLSYLRKIPLNDIKIDQSFVADMQHSEDGRAIVAAVLAISQSLGLRTVAEGVENESQQSLLTKLGCEHVQGYLLGYPVPAGEVPGLFTKPVTS